MPNKRENMNGEATDLRGEIFQLLPPNVFLDKPDFKFSLEDHFNTASVITTGWSSVGMDWQMRGKPCVTYDARLPMYPPETHFTGTSKLEYFQNLTAILDEKTSLSSIKQEYAKNWFEYSNFLGAVRLPTSAFDLEILRKFWKFTGINSITYRIFPTLRKYLEVRVRVYGSDEKRILEFIKSNKSSIYP
jgi:hypothetical protein